MPLQFGLLDEPLPVVIIPDRSLVYYTWDLKTWWKRSIGLALKNFSYSATINKFAATLPGTPTVAPVNIAVGTNIISSQVSVFVGLSSLLQSSGVSSVHYVNEQWFLCEQRYVHRFPNDGSIATRYSVATGLIMATIIYDATTSRYIIAGETYNYYTTNFSSFLQVSNGLGVGGRMNSMCVGSGGRIVSVGWVLTAGKISTSDNSGGSWTARTLNPPAGVTTYTALVVVYVSQLGMYFIGCQGGLIYSSSDAITWTHRITLTNAASPYTLGYSEKLKKVLAVGCNSLGLCCVESTNGITWIDSAPVNNDSWTSLMTSPNKGVITR